MEKKNTILLTVIAVATLLVAVVGATFAYFTATATTGEGTGTAETGTTEQLGSTNINMATTATQGASDMKYPGGMMVAAAEVSATVTGDQTYDMTYDVKVKVDTSALTGSESVIKYTVYRVDTTPVSGDLVSGCTYHEDDLSGGSKKYYYTGCTAATGITTSTAVKTETQITEHTDATEITITDQKFSNVTNAGAKAYYYVVVSYENSESDQTTTDSGKTITAQFTGLTNGRATLVQE